jgi:4-amino-4-deoxy-L-arabinose transferase-like glycosyltransferase
LVAIFVLALVVRLVVLAAIARTPYAEVGNVDSESYLAWANDIVRQGWRPTKLFYQSPLYAWYLAALQETFGASTWPPRIGQVVLGSVSAALLYAIGARLVGPFVGWTAGIGLALYGPLVLEEVTLSKTSLLVTTVLASFALYLRAAPRAHAGGLFGSGLLFGTTVVGVAQWVLGFVALAAYVPFMAHDAPPPRRATAVAAFVLGGILMVAPIAAWNTAQAGGLVLTSGGAGLNFFIGNNPDATGLPGKPPGLRDVPLYEEEDSRRLAEIDTGRPMTEASVSRYWIGRGLAFIAGNPGDYLRLLGKKVVVLWNAFEVPDNYHYAFVRAEFVPLLHAALTFAIVGPLALVGGLLPFWRRRQLTALYLVTGSIVATLLVYYVRGRYRIAAVPFLMVFAAIALERLRHAIVARDGIAVAWRGAALVVAAVFVNQTYCDPPKRPDGGPLCLADDTWFDLEWLRIMEGYERHGDYEQALVYARRTMECRHPQRPEANYFAIGTAAARSAIIHRLQGDEATMRARVSEAEDAFRRTVATGRRVDDAFFNRLLLLGKLDMAGPLQAAISEGVRDGTLEPDTLERLTKRLQDEGRCTMAATAIAVVDPAEAERVRARCVPR